MVATSVASGTAETGAPSNARRPLLRSGWPLSVIFIGFPLWWLIGLTAFIFPLMAIPMLVRLLHLPRIRVPRGFGFWLLFLVWMLASSVVLQADAPGAIPGSSSSRYLTFLYRALLYLTGTIALLYVGNLSEKELPSIRVARQLAYMFIVVAGGGLLGVFLPHLEFRSLLEILLPGKIANASFVNSLIHPSAAQVQDVLGFSSPRPSAPFPYTNTWAANLNCYLPFFLLAWGGKDAGWRRVLAPIVLAVTLLPVVVSLDRGLWIGLGVAAVYAVVRMAVMGRTAALTVLIASVVSVVAIVLLSPLGHIIELRLQHPHSNVGRANLSTLTVSSALHGSPVIGFGTTRNVQGNFNTIAGGVGAGCLRCEPPAMGTQGDVWRLFFSYGFVGAGLYLVFFARQFAAYIRSRDRFAVAGCCVLLVSAVLMFVYDSLGPQYFTVMLAVGLMWRRGATSEREQLPASGTQDQGA
jgi:hypothetical protein